VVRRTDKATPHSDLRKSKKKRTDEQVANVIATNPVPVNPKTVRVSLFADPGNTARKK